MQRKRPDTTELLTLPEVAKVLKVSLSTVRAWIREGKLSSIKVGHFRRVRGEDLESFIEGGRRREERYPPFPSDDPLFQSVGVGDSGFKEVSLKHNRYLAEAMEDQITVFEECRRLQEEILKFRKGKPLPSLTALIHETREERPRG